MNFACWGRSIFFCITHRSRCNDWRRDITIIGISCYIGQRFGNCMSISCFLRDANRTRRYKVISYRRNIGSNSGRCDVYEWGCYMYANGRCCSFFSSFFCYVVILYHAPDTIMAFPCQFQRYTHFLL